MTYKMIIDTDPGVDDALAIAYAVNHPEIELVGLTTIFWQCVGGSIHRQCRLLARFARVQTRPRRQRRKRTAQANAAQLPLISFMVKTALATSRLNTLPTSNRII